VDQKPPLAHLKPAEQYPDTKAGATLALIDLKRDWLDLDQWADGLIVKADTCRTALSVQLPTVSK
jgi:hypothetical protein